MSLLLLLAACAAPPAGDSAGAARTAPDTTTTPTTDGCDGRDDDADGQIDEDAPTTRTWADQDGDGFGDPASPVVSCAPVPGTVADATDCAPYDPDRHPGAPEACDTVDSDCDGSTQDEDAVTGLHRWCADADGDGHGDPARCVDACDPPAGHVEDATDCDDLRADVNPRAPEVCDDADVDEDCDGTADDADEAPSGGTAAWPDADGDGYGAADADPSWPCSPPVGSAPEHTDCDDADPLVHPGAADPADDGRDLDCDGLARRRPQPASTISPAAAAVDEHPPPRSTSGASGTGVASRVEGSHRSGSPSPSESIRSGS